ncbi:MULTISPECIES: GTP diphosphokinase [Idiomarina]|uniref:GTP diphosphokinase n=1 Tax=Idiomarina TaxID=135575 RepID=UPI00138A0A3F|nr:MULTISPECIES: GTP diphosphokinase [Idiomarina]MRJ40967.1 GTP diphosphokinase [Idiomarina sp. FeN1]NCU56771.1 GTP diphosphokinase [Idiomarina sp. FenA--70]NCU59151.1 GTP diphosphokinase [Idiomarina sp. FenBw--71]UUN14361.1 GTP diphosphokinase [Idiomarina loihiensis]
MVFVRSTHVDKPSQTGGDWLAHVDSKQRKQVLTELSQQLQQLLVKQPKAAHIELKGQEMVEILAGLGLDQETLVAALLSPAYELKLLTPEQVTAWGGESLLQLMQAVQQMQSISALQHFQHGKPNDAQIDNVRRMLLAMVADVRAVLIKLAERICFLREVKGLDEETRVLAAKECHEIYAPLANRLGIGQLKWELEDLAFRYLHPNTYKAIAKQLLERRIDRETYIHDFVHQLQQALHDECVEATVYGRPKHIYSIWRKMQKKHLNFTELYDIRAVRIITTSLKDCYAALGVVHSLWRHIGSEFDDYIATPKANGYQSIHTVVLGPADKHVEIQIRTQTMHDDAELGVAAHWMYKEGAAVSKGQGLEEKIAWLRKLLAWHDDMAGNDELVAEIRSQVFEDRVYVFTPKGEVIDLPNGATPLDFAYYIHSQVGHRCVGAKVDGHIVPFTYALKNGERVEILTQKNAQPRRDWLNPTSGYLQTSRARAKVATYFKKLDRDKNIKAGKELLEPELAKHGIPLSAAEQVLERFNMTHLDDLIAGIGAGDVRLQHVVNQLKPATDTAAERIERLTAKPVKQRTGKQSDVTVEGIGNLLVQFAKCCQPVPGDSILGFVTQGRGVSVHRKDCEQLQHLLDQHPERALAVSWSEQKQANYRVDLRLIANDRQGLLHDITSVLANERASVAQLDSKRDEASALASIRVGVMVADQAGLQRLVSRLSQLKGVHEVVRVPA